MLHIKLEGKNGMETKQENADVEALQPQSSNLRDFTESRLFFDRVQRIVLDLAKNGKKPESILDVGCGTGRLLRKAKEQWPNARLIGVDAAEKMIRAGNSAFSRS